MSKKIKFEIVDIVRNEVHVRITEQTHRMLEFGDNSKIFTTGNGFDLISDWYPAVDPFCKGYEFYLQGEKQDRDDEILVFTTEQFMAYVKAVTEYNKYFKDWSDVKDEKDEPKFKIGDWVYHIHAQKYVKITEIDIEKKLYRFEAKDDIDGDLVVIFYVLPARKRLKTFEELQGLVGKAYISSSNVCNLITLLFKQDGKLYLNGIDISKRKIEFLDGSSVYEFEHLNENGEWVK